MNNFFLFRDKGTLSKTNDTFISSCDSVRCFFNLYKYFAFYTNMRILFNQLNFSTFLSAMKINNSFSIYNFCTE